MKVLLLLGFSLGVWCLSAQQTTVPDSALVLPTDTGITFGMAADSAMLDSFYQRFGISYSAAAHPALYDEVFRWYRTCYRYGGSGKKGIDCSGFVNMIYQQVYGKEIPRASYLIYEQCRALGKTEEKREGDLVFFKIRKKRISHVGVYLQNNKFVHASTQLGVTISDLSEDYYRKYFYRAGRLN